MSTVEEVKTARSNLESTLLQSIKDFEDQHGVTVDNLRFHRAMQGDGSSVLADVDLEVSV